MREGDRPMGLVPERSTASVGLVEVIDRLLDKGLVINADIQVSLVGVELLGVKLRAALASFDTAARYGLEFPGGMHVMRSPGWQAAQLGSETCPACGKRSVAEELLSQGCPWCGWESAKARRIARVSSLHLPPGKGMGPGRGEGVAPVPEVVAMVAGQYETVSGEG